jgi:nitroreductase
MKENLMAQKKYLNTSKTSSLYKYKISSLNLKPIKLLKPKFNNGNSVFKSLKQRKTTREISDKKIPLQVLSNLLWAAWGINRKKGPFGIPGRTAASASNSQEIDLYVALQEGIYIYNAVNHRLDPVLAGDLRKLAVGAGQANFVSNAPVQLIYVVDIHRLIHTSGFEEPGLHNPEVQKSYFFVDTGLIAGNVFLFAASQGLATWFHNCNRPALNSILKLRAQHRVLFGQTVGYPAKRL